MTTINIHFVENNSAFQIIFRRCKSKLGLSFHQVNLLLEMQEIHVHWIQLVMHGHFINRSFYQVTFYLIQIFHHPRSTSKTFVSTIGHTISKIPRLFMIQLCFKIQIMFGHRIVWMQTQPWEWVIFTKIDILERLHLYIHGSPTVTQKTIWQASTRKVYKTLMLYSIRQI